MTDPRFPDALSPDPASPPASPSSASSPDQSSPDLSISGAAEQSPTPGPVTKLPTMWEQMGGPMGMLDSALPVVVFVAVNSFAGLYPAIFAALGAGVLIAIFRLVRKRPVMHAISGLFGVGIAAFIAYKSGSAGGFFKFGIWSYLVYGGALIVSVLVRWPLIGLIWESINGRGRSWRQDKKLVRRYDLATGVWIAIFAARYLVQNALLGQEEIGWLATAKIIMGTPLYILGILITVWIVVRGTSTAMPSFATIIGRKSAAEPGAAEPTPRPAVNLSKDN